MSSFTKKAIMEAFLRLVGKKTLDKITVRDIVDECGINRNTFYYHFQDMYAVLEEICQELTERLPKDASLCETMNAFLKSVGDFAVEHPRSTHGLVISLGYDGVHRYMAPHLQGIVMDCLSRENISGSEEYLRHLTLFVCHAIIGLSVDILKVNSPTVPSVLTEDVACILKKITSTRE